MFISVRTSGLVRRLSLISTALLAFACTASGANAQTAPQLLPYTVKVVAGGGTVAIASGATCPVSGFKSTDAYGDGCLATEIQLVSPRYATVDKNGNVFFSDYTNHLVRRVDAATGVVTAVAGGAAKSPAKGAACGSGTSTDADGDGCPATSVELDNPTGLVFDTTGNLYFADYGYNNVREVAATGGVITTTGIISNIAGGTTYGYNVNNTAASGSVIAATQSYLNEPYGLAIDTAGNLYVADEDNNALEVINLTASTETIQGLSVPAGTIAKIVGYGSLSGKSATSGDCPDFVSTSSRGGCYFGTWTDGSKGVKSNLDGGYSVAVDPSGNVYFNNEFNTNVGIVTSANILSDYAGIQGSIGKKLVRGTASSTGIGSNFGIAADANSNVYITDSSSGVIWRVDGAGKSMYVIAGGAATPCSVATDTYGDGCPATQATFGLNGGTGTFSSTKAPGPGIFGVAVDAYSDLYVGDTITNLVRKVASGTQFGPVGAGEPTQTVDIHFAAGDSPAASAYTLTAGSSNFSFGTANCTANSDGTVDCLLPITATPTTLGLFTGTLQVTSTQGGVGTFPLSGTYVQSPITRTAVTAVPSGTCTGTTISTANAVTLTASLTANGPAAPGGSVTFFSNGTAIGTPQSVVNLGSTATPVYGATLTYTFSTVGTYTITATYSGDSYFKPSTGTAPSAITSTTPSFSAALTAYQESSITAGGTALYSFNVVQSVYTGTITFACSGLPAGASCLFSPSSITANGCSNTSTVALSINTQQGLPVSQSALGLTGRGPWQALSVLVGLSLALLIGLRRRAIGGWRFGQMWMAAALLLAASGMVACGKGSSTAASPSGTYTITVTATGSAGTTSSFPVSLKIQ